MSRRKTVPRTRPAPPGILSGAGERLFHVLPTSILENMQQTRDESALLWNIIYPRAQPTLSWLKLLRLRPLWGGPPDDGEPEDALVPYYWGHDVDGGKLAALSESLGAVAGREDLLEIDLLLVGQQNLVVVEAKHLAAAGVCGRYARARCPEVHGVPTTPCRFWEGDPAPFTAGLNFGSRPTRDDPPPPCADHYQLARCLLLARELSGRLGLRSHLWLIVPAARWREVQPRWMDFAERVTEEEEWQRLRILTWESLQAL